MLSVNPTMTLLLLKLCFCCAGKMRGVGYLFAQYSVIRWKGRYRTESFNTEGNFSQRSVHSLPVPRSVFAFKEKYSTSRFLGTWVYCLPAAASQCISGWKLLSHDPTGLWKPAFLGTPWRDSQQTAEDLCYLALISSILPRKPVPVLGWSPQQKDHVSSSPGREWWAEVPSCCTSSSHLKGPGADLGRRSLPWGGWKLPST